MRVSTEEAVRRAAEQAPEFDKAVNTFCPRFGDTEHIRLVEIIGDIRALERELDQKVIARKGGAKLAEEIVARRNLVMEGLNRAKAV